MCMVTNHQTRLPRATSSLALNASRDGASTTSLGNLFQCDITLWVNNFLLTPNLNLPSQFKTIPPFLLKTYTFLPINAYLRTWRDIFKILFKHNWFGVWTDEVNFKSSNLGKKNKQTNKKKKTKNNKEQESVVYDCLGGTVLRATKMSKSTSFHFTQSTFSIPAYSIGVGVP